MTALSIIVKRASPSLAHVVYPFFRARTLKRWAERPANACLLWHVTVFEPGVSHSFECYSGDLASRCLRAGLSE